MTTTRLGLRWALFASLLCACVALFSPNRLAGQGDANAGAAMASTPSDANDGAGVSVPAPSQIERWLASPLFWFLAALAMVAWEALLGRRRSTARSAARPRFGSCIVPACITFGPLFMTNIAGTASPEHGNLIVFTGVIMLSFGLGFMIQTIEHQRRRIEEILEARDGAA
jgi:hypothetical protein